jgi:hypothetical protein
MMTEKNENLIEAITHLVRLIADVNTDIEIAQQRKDNLGLRQYQHLKKDYTNQLNDLLRRLNLVSDLQPA